MRAIFIRLVFGARLTEQDQLVTGDIGTVVELLCGRGAFFAFADDLCIF